MTEFAKQLAKNIRAKIAELKCRDTVGMSIGNLHQITPTPSPALAGAPAGPAEYKALFGQVVATITVKGFRIYD